MLRKPKNMVKAPSVSSTGVVGSVSSAYAPMQAPIMPNGSRILISPQFAFLRLAPPRTSEAVKSSARTSGTANCSGCDSASSGTEISAEPKPVMPRMKYALIRMHNTSTMSATERTRPFFKNEEDRLVLPRRKTAGGRIDFVLQSGRRRWRPKTPRIRARCGAAAALGLFSASMDWAMRTAPPSNLRLASA